MNATPSATTAAPAAPQLDPYDDAMSGMYAELSSLREAAVDAGTTAVENDEDEQRQQQAAEQAAREQQKANAATAGKGFFDSVGGFFSDVANDIAKGRFGSIFGDAGHDVEAAWNSPRFWNDLKVGMEYVAAVAAAVATTVATFGTGAVASTIGAAAAITAASATATEGWATERTQTFAANAQDGTANMTGATNAIHQLQESTQDVIVAVKADDHTSAGSLHALSGAIDTNDQTTVAPATTTIRG